MHEACVRCCQANHRIYWKWTVNWTHKHSEASSTNSNANRCIQCIIRCIRTMLAHSLFSLFDSRMLLKHTVCMCALCAQHTCTYLCCSVHSLKRRVKTRPNKIKNKKPKHITRALWFPFQDRELWPLGSNKLFSLCSLVCVCLYLIIIRSFIFDVVCYYYYVYLFPTLFFPSPILSTSI